MWLDHILFSPSGRKQQRQEAGFALKYAQKYSRQASQGLWLTCNIKWAMCALWSQLKLHTWAVQECKVKIRSARCLCWTHHIRRAYPFITARWVRVLGKHLAACTGRGGPWAWWISKLPLLQGWTSNSSASLCRSDLTEEILIHRVCWNWWWEDASSSCVLWKGLQWNGWKRLGWISQVWKRWNGSEHLENAICWMKKPSGRG